MVDLAPGEETLAAGHGAGLVDQGECAALVAVVQPTFAAEIEGHRVAAEDGRDQAGAACQPTRLAGHDRPASLDASDPEAGQERLQVHTMLTGESPGVDQVAFTQTYRTDGRLDTGLTAYRLGRRGRRHRRDL